MHTCILYTYIYAYNTYIYIDIYTIDTSRHIYIYTCTYIFVSRRGVVVGASDSRMVGIKARDIGSGWFAHFETLEGPKELPILFWGFGVQGSFKGSF